MRITVRDLEILRFLLDQKCASAMQLGRRFWKGAVKQTIYGRLKELQGKGLIKLIKISHRYIGVYILTRKGYRVLKAKELHGKLGFYVYRESRNLYRNLHLVDIRILFYELGFKGWASNRLLRKNKIHSYGWVPDALIHYRNNTQIAIELALWRKHKKTYLKIFAAYKSLNEIDAVFYLVGCESLKSELMQLAKEYPRAYFCIYDEFKEKQQNAVFENANESFILKKII